MYSRFTSSILFVQSKNPMIFLITLSTSASGQLHYTWQQSTTDMGFPGRPTQSRGLQTLNHECHQLLQLFVVVRKIQKMPKQGRKEILLKIIKPSSTHTWRHINLLSAYDFSEIKTEPIFNIKAIMATKITR